jgi:phosphatidylethanolamine/phosphatidyl-N-methylethanolamine N-methyltransferase
VPQRAVPRPPQRRRADVPLARRLQDEARFLKSWFGNPAAAGAIAPSGPALAAAMAQRVDPAIPGPVVELGPGTGPVTAALVARGIDEARLVLVEFDPQFCALLASRYPRARIVNGDAYSLGRTLRHVLSQPAAAIVSGLPLLNRPDQDRRRLIEQAFAVLAPNAPFIQFTYGITSPVPRRGLRLQCEVFGPVWLNIPPARVWVYRPGDAAIRRPAARPDLIDRLAGKVKDEIRETTEKVRDHVRARTERVRTGLRQQVARAGADQRIRPTLELIRRIAEHSSDGADTHVEADEALRHRFARRDAGRPR